MPPTSETLVVTSFPPSWQKLAEVVCPTQQAWAQRHGYDYYADCSDLRDRYYNPHTGAMELLPIKGFVKGDLMLHFLPQYRRVIWIDADCVVTNVEKQPFRPDFYSNEYWGQMTWPYDWNGHNATVIAVDSTDETFAFWWAVNNTGRKLFLKHDWVEMEASRYFAMTPPYSHLIQYDSIKALCPILPDEYEGAGVPRRVMEPYAWEPGDWSLHLSALVLERRIELARKYAP